ncbi:Ig-like domain-containing protein [Leifsonia xyli]|uniref:Ig-like domain-containing protein n=1 Tax=Leifsonia xyli TaxID=1575 RepID=UPI0012FD7053
MRTRSKISGKKALLSVGAIALASTALTLGVATGANAATGYSNQGISYLQVIPTAPATSFAAPGTTGTLSFSMGSGHVGNTDYTYGAGESNKYVLTVPQGMSFAANACAGQGGATACTISPDGKTLTLVWTAPTGGHSFTNYYNNPNPSFPVVSTGGPITGQATGTYTPFWTLTTAQAFDSVAVPYTAAAVKITSPTAGGGYANDGKTPFTGTGQPGSTITIKDASGVSAGTTTVDASGNWSVTLPSGALVPGVGSTVTVQQDDGGSITTASVVINIADPNPVAQPIAPVVTSPTAGDKYENDGKSTFTGTGQPGSTITIKDGAGNAVCTTTVDGQGNWTCTPAQGALKAEDGSTITVEQNDGTNTLTTTIVLDVAQSLDSPVVEPAGLLLASVLLAAAAGAGVVIVRRRRLAGQA